MFVCVGVEMNDVQNRRVHNDDKPFPGCLGRMVNLFDLTVVTVNGNKLLTDKPHRDHHHGYLSLSFYIYPFSFHFTFLFFATKFIALLSTG